MGAAKRRGKPEIGHGHQHRAILRGKLADSAVPRPWRCKTVSLPGRPPRSRARPGRDERGTRQGWRSGLRGASFRPGAGRGPGTSNNRTDARLCALGLRPGRRCQPVRLDPREFGAGAGPGAILIAPPRRPRSVPGVWGGVRPAQAHSRSRKHHRQRTSCPPGCGHKCRAGTSHPRGRRPLPAGRAASHDGHGPHERPGPSGDLQRQTDEEELTVARRRHFF